MKYILSLLLLNIMFVSCKKSDGNSAPVIKFKSITREFTSGGFAGTGPFLNIEVKDADGDYGFTDKDSSFIFVKNVTNPPFRLDSMQFPSNLSGANIVNIKAFVDIDLGKSSGGNSVLGPRRVPNMTRDTMYFEVYMKDFKKNKSNVIRTDDPLIYKY